MTTIRTIQGSQFSDKRGKLNFFNTFDLTKIVRMYEISPGDTSTVRGWQAHKEEKKWFYCNSGSFIMNLIEVDDFDSPSETIIPERFFLDSQTSSVLEISGGYATAFKAQEDNSKLLVFSDFSLEASKNDDFRFPLDTWTGDWK
ncbi:MAG: WxcM-like domain-containing protein [Maribacter sp.]